MEKKTRKNKNNSKKTKKITKIDILNKFYDEFLKISQDYIKSTKNRQELIKYEELSTQLLLKIDNIDSNGNALIRKKRKEIINIINEKLDRLH